MMYHSKLVCCLKANGKVLREFKDTVLIPFNAEYVIALKNLNTVRCVVNVFIDGDNVVPGGLVLAAGQECNLERSIRNGNLQAGNKFKFIPRTSAIEEHRGIKLEDGIIRVEYQFEKVYQRQDGIQFNNNWYSNPSGSIARGMQGVNLGPLTGGGSSNNTLYSTSATAMVASATTQATTLNDVGITVPGSNSEQKFSTATWFPTEMEKHTIVLKILGETADNKPVPAPVTVKAKPKCTSCGKVNKAGSAYCSSCGTALELF